MEEGGQYLVVRPRGRSLAKADTNGRPGFGSAPCFAVKGPVWPRPTRRIL